MKIENFHCTVSIYPGLPWFHTWPSHTRSSYLCFHHCSALKHWRLTPNVSHELKITIYATSTCFRAPASSDGCESEESPLWHIVVSCIFPEASNVGYCHWQHIGEEWLPVSSGTTIPILLTSNKSCKHLLKALLKICTLNCSASSLLESCRDVLPTRRIRCVK